MPGPTTQWAFTSPFEGVVEHLYIDSRGHVTCGAGFLVPSASALGRYPWHPSVATALGDWHDLQVIGNTPGFEPAKHVARSYRLRMCARLYLADIRHIFDERVDEFRQAIAAHWDLSSQPACVQIALVDMAYSLGTRGLSAYRRMRLALQRRDYAAASAESERGGVQAARNDATRRLIASAGGVHG